MAQPITIPMYAGNDLERISDLRRAVENAKRDAMVNEANRRDGDDFATPVAKAEEAYDAFVAEAAERAEMWEIHPIGHAEFRALLKDHPPRKGEDGELDPEDATFGVNTETFGQALLTFVDPEDSEIRTVAGPHEGDALRKRLKRLTAGEFDTLWVQAFQLNTGGVADPKARLSSNGSRTTSVT